MRVGCWWQVLVSCFANLNYARDWLWRSHNLCRVSAYAFTNTAGDCLRPSTQAFRVALAQSPCVLVLARDNRRQLIETKGIIVCVAQVLHNPNGLRLGYLWVISDRLSGLSGSYDEQPTKANSPLDNHRQTIFYAINVGLLTLKFDYLTLEFSQ